jgi:hypothetical protein
VRLVPAVSRSIRPRMSAMVEGRHCATQPSHALFGQMDETEARVARVGPTARVASPLHWGALPARRIDVDRHADRRPILRCKRRGSIFPVCIRRFLTAQSRNCGAPPATSAIRNSSTPLVRRVDETHGSSPIPAERAKVSYG